MRAGHGGDLASGGAGGVGAPLPAPTSDRRKSSSSDAAACGAAAASRTSGANTAPADGPRRWPAWAGVSSKSSRLASAPDQMLGAPRLPGAAMDFGCEELLHSVVL